MRRKVHTQKFMMAARERAFCEKLTRYLQEGYGVAGLGEAKTTSRQRAVGFVMTTFQKIMSSSPRAIRQALRRRLLVLLAREQMELETRASKRTSSADFAERILRLQDEMRNLAVVINNIAPTQTQRAEADAYIAQLKQRLARRIVEEESTSWALDGDEEGEEGLYAETDIPNESSKVRELLRAVPEGTDRKFDTLVRAIQQLRRENAAEKFVIFTQYRETLEFIYEELGKLYGRASIVTVKGGPLDEKIAAVESLWSPNGAHFLISTSAGGEGINLQTARILFNYDLPWNPMAVEQRIGRIHRYGQRDTVQVYNLVAEDTVEEQIYNLLEDKLLGIASVIGKVDPVTGQVVEDFRSEILGFLGSSPNYQDLYRKALVDRDYRRTEREISEALEKARSASEALRTLTQDLNAFNLEHYRTLRGDFKLDDLRIFVEKAIIRLGGAILPDDDFYRIETPEVLWASGNLARTYRDVTFDRALAMRRRKAQLLGLGHPLVDALIDYLQSLQHRGEATAFPTSPQNNHTFSIRCLIQIDLENGKRRKAYQDIRLSEDGSWIIANSRSDVERLSARISPASLTNFAGTEIRERVKTVLGSLEASWRADTEGAVAVRGSVVGVEAHQVLK
jgi:hypothetical protein